MKRASFALFCIVLMLGGMVLIAQARQLPRVYNPPQFEEDVTQLEEQALSAVSRGEAMGPYTDRWHRLHYLHQTERPIMYARGTGLVLLGLTIGLAGLFLFRSDHHSLAKKTSPRISTLFILYNAALLLLFISPWLHLLLAISPQHPWWSNELSQQAIVSSIAYILLVAPLNFLGSLLGRAYHQHKPLRFRYEAVVAAPHRWLIATLCCLVVLLWFFIYAFVVGLYAIIPGIVLLAATVLVFFGGTHTHYHHKSGRQ